MRQCAICGKTSQMGGTRKLLRGHYNPTGRSRKYPNLQKVLIPNGKPTSIKIPAGKSVLACARCIRTLNKAK